ncbi:MAG: TM0106 family RecB-like putative nuclease [Actinomycetota bacterium]|nr:TM0106 family RecB-like putative nuclease [Actinomycetota bacterium]
MQARSDGLVFSPSDLNSFLACPHLTTLELAVARGELRRALRVNLHADLIRRKGQEHEARYLEQLRAEGRDVVAVSFDDRDWRRAARETEEAIRGGAGVVYQACLADGRWRGFADFVVRQPNGLYEVVDTKLARHARPEHVLQLSFYTEQLARIQGRMPDAMHVVTGPGERETFRPDDYAAYYRRLRERFLDAVEARRMTYPYPVNFCSLCDFLSLCKAQWERDDHLVLVAGVSRIQVERLAAAEIHTLTELAEAEPATRVKSMRPATFESLRHQAELQLYRRRTGERRVDFLRVEQERGFALLPEPSAGDVWLDFEGDPWFEPARGLEYLTGWIELDGAGRPDYHCLWAHDRASEKEAFERFVDQLVERRRRFPRMHVYHYAPYERTALTRLMGEHATREEEVDDLLRGEALVDLYRVLRQALRASVPRYSLKDVEELYGFERRAEVGGGGESVHAFETWLESGEASLLDGIRAYNEEDCRSLFELHRWLLLHRPADVRWRLPPDERERSEEAEERDQERARVREALLLGATEAEPRWLLAHLLDYHARESRPQWWEYFFHKGLDEEELIDDGDTIGALELARDPMPVKRSLEYTFTFPSQEHRISGAAVDPASERRYAVSVDDERGRVTIRRGITEADERLPRALIPPKPLPTWVQRDAVLRFAKRQGEYPALVEILERRPPRARLDGSLGEAALSLEGSYLFVQGPPGSGKTWNGARMAIALMKAGQRVGVTALSHKAIHKFLEELEDAAVEQGYSFTGLKKSGGEEDSAYRGRGFVENVGDNAAMLDPDAQFIAGTSFLFSREEFDQHVDTLFIDEGGQFALADALAVGTAARNLVLLGDPNQLPQVAQGSHPPGANASVLGHLLGADATVRPGMGMFLEETWRLRPEVNGFISETFYEGRLQPAPVTSNRSVADGNAIRFLPVEHAGHRTAAPEEAEAVATEIGRLLGTPYRDADGERALRLEDFVVVAPYNSHVRCLRRKIPDGRVRIGTVDKFQGQEATVVFFSLASSSGEDVPRGLEFLFSRNRLNVALSRARCLAYLVASPRLLETSCKTVEQMRLVNALCRLVEVAA